VLLQLLVCGLDLEMGRTLYRGALPIFGRSSVVDSWVHSTPSRVMNRTDEKLYACTSRSWSYREGVSNLHFFIVDFSFYISMVRNNMCVPACFVLSFNGFDHVPILKVRSMHYFSQHAFSIWDTRKCLERGVFHLL
jgi:hypothetical protein